MHFRWGISLDASNVRKIAKIYCHKIVFTCECITKCVWNILTEMEMQNFSIAHLRIFNCWIASFRNLAQTTNFIIQLHVAPIKMCIKAWADILMRSSSTHSDHFYHHHTSYHCSFCRCCCWSNIWKWIIVKCTFCFLLKKTLFEIIHYLFTNKLLKKATST